MERQAERRLITAVFVDVVGSTDLQMRMGPERMKRAIDAAFVELRKVIVDQGGTVEKFIGDAVFAVFGAPTAHEDDALRALRAAEGCVQWAQGTAQSNVPFSVRVGVETGDALVDVHGVSVEHQQMAVGPCVNAAARLQSAADPMTILVGPTCREAVGAAASFNDLGERELKGLGRTAVFELVRTEAEAQRARLPFIGRESELEMLDLARRRARSGRSVLALVAAPPGQGKSRLVEEFLSRSDELAVLAARCRPAGEIGARNVLRQLLTADTADGTPERVRERVAELLPDRDEATRVAKWLAHSAGVSAEELGNLGNEERQDEITDAWRRYLGALASQRPTAVWIEDLHWSEPELVRLVDRLTNGTKIPLLVIATARPEFADQAGLRPSGDRMFIELAALSDDDARALARSAGASDDTSAERGEGNPLFIIELARVRGSDSLPLTLQGAIGARLDDLPPADRELLSRAAVVGETFAARDAALLAGRDAGEVARTLDRLVDRQYLESVRGAYRFAHALVRDVAYQRLPVADRMRLHARFAREGIDASEVETAAHHWWEALRPPDAEWVWEGDETIGTLREQAFGTMMAAGGRYAQRFAHAAALTTYEHASAVASTALQRAQVERALADAYRLHIASDDAWAHYLRARDAYREAGAVPPDLYADMSIVPAKWPGGFKSPPEDAEVFALLAEGELVARERNDVMSLATIVLNRLLLNVRPQNERADLKAVNEVEELLRSVNFPEGSADLLVSIVETHLFSLEDPDAAMRELRLVDDLLARGAHISDDDSLQSLLVSLAVDRGRLEEARALSAAYIAASERKGPHLLSHALYSSAMIAWCAGDRATLLEMTARSRRLLEQNPGTRFCMGGVGATLRDASTLLAVDGRLDEARELFRTAYPIAMERGRDRVFVLPYAIFGSAAKVDDILMTTRRTMGPVSAALALCVLERWDELPSVLERLDGWATRGGAAMGALSDAIREEMAAANGGPSPRHERLHQLGFHGWSQLVSYRAARA